MAEAAADIMLPIVFSDAGEATAAVSACSVSSIPKSLGFGSSKCDGFTVESDDSGGRLGRSEGVVGSKEDISDPDDWVRVAFVPVEKSPMVLVGTRVCSPAFVDISTRPPVDIR